MKEHYYEAVSQIIHMGHWVTDQVSQELKIFEITEPQYNVLRTLDKANGGPLTVGEILSEMYRRNSNVTRIIDKLIKKGYVTRQECPTNRRKMDILMTPAGQAILKACDEKVQALHLPLSENLSSQELAELARLLRRLRAQDK